MTDYLIYRHGANAANQHCVDCAPVAIVSAASRAAAVAVADADAPPRVDAPRRLALALHVTIWANQRVSAVPASQARKADLLAVLEM